MSSTPPSLTAVDMISIKRENFRPHSEEELAWWMESYVSGDIPDYQMSAWLMAVCWRGMNETETSLLTKYMVQSGKLLEWPSEMVLVDKHSSGGVGDKVSLILAPLVVAASNHQVRVPMMAGRGLGHTGGTLDKLESIPGFQVNLPIDKFQSIVETVGCSIVSATREMVVADRKLYALRDVTATVSCVPLQTASIICKKIAEHPNSLVLDCKYGRAAFQSNVEQATTLATSLISVAEENGVSPTTAFLTRMDHPIGTSVGNWLEVNECIDILKSGRGSKDLVQLVVVQAAQMLVQGGVSEDLAECVDLVYNTLLEGRAFPVFRDMVEAQGGDTRVLDNPETYPSAKYETTIVAPQDGYVADVNAMIVGRAAVSLGAGRLEADEPVDATAGIVFYKKVGDQVTKGIVVATIHCERSKEILKQARCKIEKAIEYSTTPVQVPAIITHQVSSDGVQEFTMPTVLQ
jgi:pyrimidine-nucleoside phosphorylase